MIIINFITALFVAGALGAYLFAALFAWRSRGWFGTDIGRNLMAMDLILAVLFSFTVAGRFLGPLPAWIWIIGIALLDTVIWRRVFILWRRQHERTTQ